MFSEQIDNGILRINEDFSGLNDDLDEVIDELLTNERSQQLIERAGTDSP